MRDLFDSIQLGAMALANRLVRVPPTRGRADHACKRAAGALVPVLAALVTTVAHAQGINAPGAPIGPLQAPPGTDFSKLELETEKLAPHFYTLTGSPGVDPVHPEGAAGRIGFLEGPDGIVMVDAQYAPVSGTLKGMSEALDLMLQVAGPRTTLVPGHGPIVQRAKVAEQRDIVLAVQARVADLIAQGRSRAEVVAAKPTASFDPQVPGAALAPVYLSGISSADRFVGSVYDELSRSKQ